jgi:hypothetical protein
MNTKLAIMTGVGLAAGLVSGCGGGQGQSAAGISPPVSTFQSLDTEKLLAQARASSETGAPYAVDGGALTLTDTSDTSEPLGIDGM